MQEYSIRKLKREDAPLMLSWMQDENVTHYLRINGANMTVDDTLRFIVSAQDESVSVHRAVVDEHDRYLGTVSLKNIAGGEAEYAIAMSAEAQGTGAAAAATKQIVAYGLQELGLKRIYLNVLLENKRAVRFYEKVGFSPAGETMTDYNGNQKILLWFECKNTL